MRFALLLALAPAALYAATPQPILHHDFEQNESGWVAFGSESARVHLTHDPLAVHGGKGALELDYDASPDKPALMMLPVTQPLTGMRSISLWLRADIATAAAITLGEREGGRYSTVVWLEPVTWQRVELVPEDFLLARGPGDPKDLDGKLDLDQVMAISIVDISQIFNAAMAHTEAPLAIASHDGPHKLFLDDFEVSRETPAWYKPATPFQIDTFAHPHLAWFTVGGADLSMEGHAMKMTYQQLEDKFVVVIRVLPQLNLTSATHIGFDISSEKSAQIVLSLTEQLPDGGDGARYTAQMDVSAGEEPHRRQLRLAAFKRDENGPPDADGKLDLDQLKTMTIVDITGVELQETRVNTMTIGNIEAVKSTSTPK